jgi:hypothetical protein
MTGEPPGEQHQCARPEDEAGVAWSGARDSQNAPIWLCPECRRWWGHAWPGTGGRIEDMAWLPMRDLFTDREPAEFDDLITAARDRETDAGSAR